MPSKKQTIRTIIKIVLEALAAILICGVLVFVSSNQISNIVSSISQTKKISLEGQARSIAISKLENQLSTINGNNAKIDVALLHVDNIIPFINALKALSTKDAVQQNYSFGGPLLYVTQGNLSVYSVPFNITISGNMNSFINYLNDFQNMPFFAEISSVIITAPTGLKLGSSMSMTATLFVEQ